MHRFPLGWPDLSVSQLYKVFEREETFEWFTDDSNNREVFQWPDIRVQETWEVTCQVLSFRVSMWNNVQDSWLWVFPIFVWLTFHPLVPDEELQIVTSVLVIVSLHLVIEVLSCWGCKKFLVAVLWGCGDAGIMMDWGWGKYLEWGNKKKVC